ncbi:putative dehydrogenase [Abditibacterium utsteinense]|uniref:Putative dehydrogenase n=1 Tax=Abditibacterium utsteinense TaxID=1960156 RepID=A0A2S8SPQ6_9BACT|nr:Gfo/Idh/MocA family oxidoreductase [Abditibacterium utsteinense]PQV62783.1 putative dehydrogenase [Abditibacterium utsteinense]
MSQTFNVAVIGAGAIGFNHIESFQKHPDARVVALAEVSPERGREAADKFGVETLVTDYKTLLSRSDIDVISIALPNYLHAPVGLEALQAGKNVMIDKPIATNAADAQKLVEEAKKQGTLLMVGQNNRMTPQVQTAKQLITRGDLGEVYHCKTAMLRHAGIPRIGSWFTQTKFAGGGATYDIGVHALDRALYLMGEFEAESVSGQTFAKFGPRGLGDGSWGKGEIDPSKPFDVDDLSIALIKLKGGRTVLLEASWAGFLDDYDGTQILGTEAGLKIPSMELQRNGADGYVKETVELLPPLVDPNRMAHFINVLQGKEEAFVKPEESLALQKILDAIYESSQTGKEVRIS